MSTIGIYIPTLANQILLANSERELAGLPPSVNLVALGIGNGCSGTDSASCGSRPSARNFLETGEGITLRFLKDHALLSTEVYESVQSACVGVTGCEYHCCCCSATVLLMSVGCCSAHAAQQPRRSIDTKIATKM